MHKIRSEQYANFCNRDGPHGLIDPPDESRVILDATMSCFEKLSNILEQDGFVECISRIELCMGHRSSEIGGVIYAVDATPSLYLRSARLDVECDGRSLARMLLRAVGVLPQTIDVAIKRAEQSALYLVLFSRERVVRVDSPSRVYVEPGVCEGDWLDVSPPSAPLCW